MDSWVHGRDPISATGCGARRVRSVGDCRDHMTVLIQYDNQVGVSFSCRQFKGHGTRHGIRNRVFGSEGVLETEYGGQVLIRGEHFYRGGRSPGIYKEGAVRNIATFHADITQGRFDNLTVPPSVRSTLVAILTRTAAHQGGTVSWKKLIASETRLEADLEGLKA